MANGYKYFLKHMRDLSFSKVLSWLLILLIIVHPLAEIFNIYFFYLFVLGGGFLVCISLTLRHKIFPHFFSNIFAVSLLYFSFLVSSLWAVNTCGSIEYLTSFSFYYLMFVCFVYLFYTVDSIFAENFILFLPVLYFALNLVIIAKYGAVRGSTSSLGSYSNHMAGVVIGCLPFVVKKIVVKPRNLMAYFLVIVSIFDLAVSQSRSVYILSLICIPCCLAAFSGNIIVFLKRLFFAVLICIIGVLIGLQNKQFESAVGRLANTEIRTDLFMKESVSRVYDDFNKREAMYHAASKAIREYPMFGIGFGSFKVYAEENYGIEVIPHNVIMRVWLASGLFGLFIFVYIMARAVLNTLSNISFTSSRGEIINNLWYKSIMISLIILLGGGMARPLLKNPMFFLVLALAISQPVAIALPHNVDHNLSQKK